MVVKKDRSSGDYVEAPPSYLESDALLEPLPEPRSDGDEDPGKPSTSSAPPFALPSSFSPCTYAPFDFGWLSWFAPFRRAQAARAVKATVSDLITDLATQRQPAPASALGVLQSCADACRAHDLSLAALLQAKTIAQHSPLYWAVINHPPGDANIDAPDLATTILAHAAPLTESAVAELRLACLQLADQTLYERLRRAGAFCTLSRADEIILGSTAPPDAITVRHVPGTDAGFVTRLEVPAFLRRMRISGTITLDFIARGRLWSLSFFVPKHDGWYMRTRLKQGSWAVTLRLLEHSPPTHVDAHLLIDAPVPDAFGLGEGGSKPSLFSPASTLQRPPIDLPLVSDRKLEFSRSPSEAVAVSLDQDKDANSLQYEDCPYIGEDGVLRLRLEATLPLKE